MMTKGHSIDMTNKKSVFPSDVADKFLLRLPDGMRDQLKASAKEGNRTMNAEIVNRLEFSFRAQEILKGEDGKGETAAAGQVIGASYKPDGSLALDRGGRIEGQPVVRVYPDGRTENVSVDDLVARIAEAVAERAGLTPPSPATTPPAKKRPAPKKTGK